MHNAARKPWRCALWFGRPRWLDTGQVPECVNLAIELGCFLDQLLVRFARGQRGTSTVECPVAEVPQGSVRRPRSGFSPARPLAPCCLLGVPCARPRGVLPPCLAAQPGRPSSTLVQSKAFHPGEREQSERDKRNARLPSRPLTSGESFCGATSEDASRARVGLTVIERWPVRPAHPRGMAG
jgi:hypothetical protein